MCEKDKKPRKKANKAVAAPERLVIYQLLPRILTNNNPACVPGGTLAQNGSGKFNDITSTVLKSIKELGVNAIWYTGVLEMATKTDYSAYGIPADNPHVVKGEAGSPYAVKDYYDVDPALAVDIDKRLDEFDALIERTHSEGMKCFIDFVPNHTARRYKSDRLPIGATDIGANDNTSYFFSPRNDYYYITNQQFAPQFDIYTGERPYVEFPAKATGNDVFSAFPTMNDWYETAKLNYGRDPGAGDHFDPIPPLWHKMAAILRYWCARGVDGFRCDMVFMVPQDFWHWAISIVKKDYPDTIFIGEIYDIGLYRPFLSYCGFDYLYDKVNLYDTIVGIETSHFSAARLTECWQAREGISSHMVDFLENHDEVRYGSDAFAGNPLGVLPDLAASSMMNTSPFLLYYGQEIGERATDNEGFAGDNFRSTIFDYWSYPSLRRWYHDGLCDGNILTPQEKWLRSLYARVLTMLNSEEALRRGAFFDLQYANLNRIGYNPHVLFSFLRYTSEQKLLIILNFSHRQEACHLHIPEEARKAADVTPFEEVGCLELISGQIMQIGITADGQCVLSIPARCALVLNLPENKI